MPETLYNNDFSAGWCPSDDQVNGRPNGLLQMTNLDLDSNGALQLVKGTQVIIAGYSTRAFQLYSRFINGIRYDYAATIEPSIYRQNVKIITGSDSVTAAFGTAFNFVLICSGSQRYKDNGSALVNLGVNPPTLAPTLTQNIINAPYQLIGNGGGYIYPQSIPAGTMSPIGGTLYAQCTTNSNGIFVMQDSSSSASDCTTLSGVGGSTDDDYIVVNGYISNPYGVSLEFDVLLVSGDPAGDLVTDGYTYVVQDLSSNAQFNSITGQFTVRMRRVDFAKVGGQALDWTQVHGFRLSINTGRAATEVINIWGDTQNDTVFRMHGGIAAQFGTYNYAQMNVNNTGSYLAKSILGPISKSYTIDGNTGLITFQNPSSIDGQVNEVWIFRQGGNLGKWYRVKRILAPFTPNPVYDSVGDQIALAIDITVDLNLTSIAASTISDSILDIVGPIQGRWYYFTPNFMYPSDVNDPDLINASQAVRICGSASEQFMWARAVSASVVIVGTSIDCYLLTGTFSTFPDGTIDVYYQSLGVKFPPITRDASAYGGAIYYYAADGWRMVTPTSFGTTYSSQNNQLIVAPNLDKLYRGIACYGYIPVTGQAPLFARSPLCIAKNKFYGFSPMASTGRCDVYDFVRQYWRALDYSNGQVTACFATQDNKVLAFYANDLRIREIEAPGSFGLDGGNITFNLMFPYKDNGKPRQRKDTYTFKMRLRTHNGGVQVTFVDETGNSLVGYETLQSETPGSTEVFMDVSTTFGTHRPKALSLSMTGSVLDLVIEDWSIDYDPRPVPLTFLRVPANNYGTTARKRIYTVPFQCDPLGNNVIITPIVDGVTQAGFTFNYNGKKGFYYLFNYSQLGTYGNQTVGRDYEWTINGNGNEFEFWGFEDIRNIEIFPDPVSCYILPKGNFGSAVRKRFRTWPFIIDTRGNNVTFNALVDNQAAGTTVFNTNGERATVFHYFNTDVFGIDYGGYFTDPAGLLEIWQAPGIGGPNNPGIMPDSVENLPIYTEFDQVGPVEIFRYGKILRMALRCFSNGTPIPFNVFIGDVSVYTGNFNVNVGVEDEYIVDLPKGVSGTILRVELGPCAFTFARYFMKFQVAISAAQKDTELQWLTIPGVSSYMAGGI